MIHDYFLPSTSYPTRLTSLSLRPTPNNGTIIPINRQNYIGSVLQRIAFPDHPVRVSLCTLKAEDFINLDREEIHSFLSANAGLRGDGSCFDGEVGDMPVICYIRGMN
jgi:hypothetical protein